MRSVLIGVVAAILAAPALAGNVALVAPPEQGQAVGLQIIEARVDGAPQKVQFYVDGALVGVARTAPFRIVHDFGDTLVPHRVAAEAFFDHFTSVARAEVTTAGLTVNDSIDVDLVEVPVTVRGARAVRPSDLKVTENGTLQTVREIRAQRPPTSFVFVLDRSLSMGDGKLDAARDAIAGALAALRPGDDAQVVPFNHRTGEAVRVANGADLAALADLAPAGGTSLRDTLAGLSPRRRTAVVVITDGGDRNSATESDPALRSIARADLTLHAAVLGRGAGADFLHEASRRTGGTFVRSSAATLVADLRQVMADINARHTVVYQSTLSGKGWREIRVAAGRGVSVSSSKRGYFAR